MAANASLCLLRRKREEFTDQLQALVSSEMPHQAGDGETSISRQFDTGVFGTKDRVTDEAIEAIHFMA
ncbi:MAG TPA: hypothetical protein VKA63_09735, partial [Candidatus Krumholzibacteria bacterium]|nr:hypothetical protein [Candidatus Krumholzibacteria bacterium]